MGSGGRATERNNSGNEVVKRAPSSKPPFTLGDIKKAIPPHCFDRSLIRSSSYLFVDLFFSFLFYYVAATYIFPLKSPLSYVAWPIYWILQGSVQMGLWVIGHECGHQAFSDYPWLNDTIGYFLHTGMLAPYFSWKYSHRRHHSNTASLENDESFVPKKKSNLNASARLLNTPPGRLFRLVILCSIGWLLYVFFNVSGLVTSKKKESTKDRTEATENPLHPLTDQCQESPLSDKVICSIAARIASNCTCSEPPLGKRLRTKFQSVRGTRSAIEQFLSVSRACTRGY
ncbi:fatty acid desaturase domain-containing protein [Artemisia annua]|uniref:Fatty acid desaturase domain-containing protein n=1 Tax=Artemisia annua TaxID=35608 RepID=A0A2U1L5Y1_ARTAN|nr:fatty acid desaturase domain-containing protein [Artemisia annua]